MATRILFIGGHGMLARPVIRRLAGSEEFTLRTLARDPEKTRSMLPGTVEVLPGDLKDIDSIRRAADGMEAVYINLSNPNPGAEFRLEPDGTANVIDAVEGNPDVLIAKISALDCERTGWWEDMDQKAEAEERIRNSGHPWLIFRPTWFFESLPLFVQRGSMPLFGKADSPLYWIAGDDYGRMVQEAFRQDKRDRIYNVQGPKPIPFDTAMHQFARAMPEDITVRRLPGWILKAAGLFNPEIRQLAKLMTWTRKHPEQFESEDTWKELAEPTMGIGEYIQYMQRTGDRPSR